MPQRRMSLKNLRKPKPVYPYTVLVEAGLPAAAIVRPSDDRYGAIAETVRGKIHDLTGAKLPVIDHGAAPVTPRRHLILLGNVNTNRVVFRLYGYSYTPADDHYPGRGGHLLHTIHDPWGNGRNAVGLFGSDIAGVEAAAGLFLDRLAAGPTLTLGSMFDVTWGPDARRDAGVPDEPDLDAEMAEAEDDLARGSHTGLWSRIGQRGLLYGLTGNNVYAEIYKRLVFRMYDHVLSDPDNYGSVWGFDADFALQYVMPGWDLVEESPVVSSEDRLRITRILYEFISDCVSHVGDVENDRVRHNHATYAALGLHYAGAYFRKYYRATQAYRWMALSEKCFGVQVNAFKPYEDCGHYHWRTHFHAMRYTLSTGDMTFFDTGNAQRAGDYAILTTDNLGCAVPNGDTASPFGTWTEMPYLRAMVCVTGDGRYQWMLDKKKEMAPRHHPYEHSRDVEPVEPMDLEGAQVYPLDPRYYDSTNGREHLPLDKTFDKVVFRDGFDPDNQYLFLDGLSNGGHKHYDGNSICRLTQNNRIWLADCDYIKSLPKFHNGVLIFKDGQSAEIPPFVELERFSANRNSGFSQTTLRSYSGVDWRRNILWSRGVYFLVVDEMEALGEAEYSFRAVWQTLGDVTLRKGGLAAEQNGEQFFIHGLPGPRLRLEDDPVTGKNWDRYEHAEPIVRILQQIADVRLVKGETYRFFNLLYCSPLKLAMTQVAANAVRIDGGRETVFAGVGETRVASALPSGPSVAAAQFQISPRSFSIVDGTEVSWEDTAFKSDRPVSLEYDLSAAQGRLAASGPTTITLSAGSGTQVELDGKPIAAADSNGAVTFRAPEGKCRIALIPPALAGIRRAAVTSDATEFTPRVRTTRRERRVPHLQTVWSQRADGAFLSLQAADLGGDGEDEVIAGGRSQSIHAYKGGGELWRFPTGGAVRSVCAADLENDGRSEIIAGSEDTRVYVLDATGTLQWSYEIPFYFQDPVVRSVFTGDINGDGNLEVIAAVESWRYHALSHEGEELWRQMTVRPSSTGCAADLDGDGRDEVIAGTDYHRWHCIDGDGEIRWSYHPATGPRANSAAAGDVDGDGLKEVAFAGADTHIHLLKADGTLISQFNTGDEVTRVLMADMDGDGRDEIVASSMSFNVYVVKGDGRTLHWRTDLGEVVNCIAAADFNGDGKPEVAAGVEDGTVYLLDNADGRPVGRHKTGGPILDIVAADVDGDGIPEIGACSEDGFLHVFKA